MACSCDAIGFGASHSLGIDLGAPLILNYANRASHAESIQLRSDTIRLGRSYWIHSQDLHAE